MYIISKNTNLSKKSEIRILHIKLLNKYMFIFNLSALTK